MTERSAAEANLSNATNMLTRADGRSTPTDVAIAHYLNVLAITSVAGVQALLDVADAIREGNGGRDRQGETP